MDKIGTKYENGRVIHQYIDTDIAKNTFDKCGYTAAELINAACVIQELTEAKTCGADPSGDN